MIRLGLVDFDTSHVVEFTKRLNHVDVAEDQWVEGAKIVAGVPGTSLVKPEVIPKYTEALKGYGVQILDRPEDLFGKIDAVLIESNSGLVHLERALPFIERGIPTFIDKPFTCSLADARTLIATAEMKHVPLMSCSSLRFVPEVAASRGGNDVIGKLLGAATYGPAPTHPPNPGLFHYGIHPTEVLFTLMGPGCVKVSSIGNADGEVTTGLWSDGRVASLRGIRAGQADYGFTAFGVKGVQTTTIAMKVMYRELLKQVVKLFETRTSPIDPRETLEIVAFIEAGKQSLDAGGTPIELKV